MASLAFIRLVIFTIILVDWAIKYLYCCYVQYFAADKKGIFRDCFAFHAIHPRLHASAAIQPPHNRLVRALDSRLYPVSQYAASGGDDGGRGGAVFNTSRR